MRRAVRVVAEALLLEVALYRCLARWLARRPDLPAGSTGIPYGRLATPMIGLFAFASALEVPLVHVIVPWDAVRLPLLVVSIWSVLWMLGLMAAYRVRPHLLTATDLRIRNGGRTEVVVPLAAVRAVAATEHDAPGSVRSVHLVGSPDGRAGGSVLVAVSGRTNLHLTLAGPTRLRTPRGEVDADHVRLWVDEPREVAARLRAVTGSSGGGVTGRRSGPRS